MPTTIVGEHGSRAIPAFRINEPVEVAKEFMTVMIRLDHRNSRAALAGHTLNRCPSLQIDLLCITSRRQCEHDGADHNGGSARVVLYERRSRVVVIGGAFRSRLEKPGSRRRQRERPLLLRIPAEYALPARSGSAGASADRPLIGTRSTLEPQRLKNRSFQLLS